MDDRLLVGRDRELRLLEEALHATAQGERAVLILTGEPGIGKTRLLEELMTRVIAAGGIATWARTWEVGLTPPFFPWLQILGALEIPGDPAPALGNLEQHGDGSGRLARFGEVVAFLKRRAGHAPIALLFDDLHASDPSSLQLLEYALPLLIGQRVLFALAARDTDASRETAAALGRLQRGASRLPLSRLKETEVAALVGDRADGRRVFELSCGNPLFVEELVAAHGTLGLLALPQLSSVRTVIRDRVARLPAATQEALVAAAVLGRDFRGQVVADMVGAKAAGALFDPAIALGMLGPTSPDRFRFSHALVAEAMADELGQAERARLHLRAAESIQERDPLDSSAVAHHLLAAGPLAGEAAISAAERAATRCMAQLAFEDAASLLDRAIQALKASAPDDRRRLAALLCARAEALQHATQHGDAAQLCEEAAAIVRALPGDASRAEDTALFARIALARGLEFRFGRTDPLLVALLREALDRLSEGALALRARLLARLAAAEQPAPDPRGPAGRGLQAVELARELDARDRLDVTYVATAALVDYVDPVVLERIHHDVLNLARGADRWISVHTRLRLCFTALERVNRADFETALHVFAAEAAALGLPRWTRQVHMLNALGALLDGRFEEAEAEAGRFEEVSREIGDTGAPWLANVHRSMHAWVRTAPQDARTLTALSDHVPGRAAIKAWFASQAGSIDETRAALAELEDGIPHDPDLSAMVSAAIGFVGDGRLAEKAYHVLFPRSGRIVLASMVGSAVMDLYDRALLRLAATAERWDAIDGHAEAALAVAARLGSPVWTARVLTDWAEALDRRGRPTDAERARALRARALPIAERLGMPGLTRLCSTPNRPPESEAAPRAHAPSEHVRTARRGELWVVTGFGEELHVPDSRGMQMIARLVAEPGTPFHALDLAGSGNPSDGGDSGPVLDDDARAAYRSRLSELVAEREEAESWGDQGRAERARGEIEALGAELERAFGLGGRARRMGSASERARSNVQRRITHAIGRIRAASPRLGEHLVATIRTGTYCVYERAP